MNAQALAQECYESGVLVRAGTFGQTTIIHVREE